jgi:hypothetical protein
MHGQTRRFFRDFDAEFGTDTPTKAMTDAWLAAREPALTPNVGTAFKNSNSTQSTYNHLFVYYTDPADSEQLVLQDDGVDTVSTASDASLGVVRGAGDVSVDLNGDMHLRADSGTDTVIGSRALVDNAGSSTLVSITAKSLTSWLQGLRDNIKALFASKVDKTTDASKVYGTDTDGEQTEYDVDSFGKVDTVNGIPADANKNVQTTYTYETEAEFEADKDNIPIGAIVIKMYEYPENHLYDLSRPDLWPFNTEIDFGGGLYGRRTNRSSQDAFAAWNEFWLFYMTNIYLVNCGGIVKLTRASDGYVVAYPVGMPSYGSNITSMPNFPFNVGFSIESAYPPVPTIAVVIRCAARFNITAYTCDLWITYKK